MKTQKPKRPRFERQTNTTAGGREGAVIGFLECPGFPRQKWEFCQEQRMGADELLEALNTAGGGEVVWGAVVELVPQEEA